MLTASRWEKEVQLVRNNFRGFEPFHQQQGVGVLSNTSAQAEATGLGQTEQQARGDVVGFRGTFPGRSGTIYTVTILALASRYPFFAPLVFVFPRVGPHLNLDGSIDIDQHWDPRRSTFASCILVGWWYLQEYG